MNASVVTDRLLGELVKNFDSKRVPLSGEERAKRPGRYPYHGANGVLDHVDGYLYSGLHLLVGEDGTVENSNGNPAAHLVDGEFWVNNHAHVLRGGDEIDTRYLFYALHTVDVRPWITGAVQPKLTQGNLNRIPIPFPNRASRESIVELLGALDDKIELNRRMNRALEEMASALFRSWFVDVDPDYTTAETLIRAGVLEIGDGYRAKNSEMAETGLPFVRAGNLNDGFNLEAADRLCADSVVKAGRKVARSGDVAFTSKGTIGRFARVDQHSGAFVYSPQVCYWRSLDRERLHPAILYCWMQTEDLTEQIRAVSGQTDMAPYVSLQDQRHMNVPKFPSSQPALADEIEPLLALQSSNVAESRILVSLRDTLLPQLLSGEIRLRDAERAVESGA